MFENQELTNKQIEDFNKILAYIIINKDNLNLYEINESIFKGGLYSTLFKGIRDCKSNQLYDIYTECLKNDPNISKEIMGGLKKYIINIEKGYINFSTTDYNKLVGNYTEEYLYNKTLQTLSRLNEDVEPSQLYNVITKIKTQLENGNNTSYLQSFDDVKDDYIQELEHRVNKKKYTFGELSLDNLLDCSAEGGEITILGGSTSAGKSVFALNLINSLIESNSPCMYLSLEMSKYRTLDRLLSLRLGQNFINQAITPNNPLYNQVVENLNKIKNSNFYCSFEPSLDFKKLRQIIREYKINTHNDYCLIFIDLLTMVREFNVVRSNQSLANGYEFAMNELSVIAKEENVHIFGLVQLNRESDNIKILKLDDLEKIKPNIASVKNGSAIAERCRNFITLFRPNYYIDRYLKNDATAQEYKRQNGDKIELQLLKSSDAECGKSVFYNFYANCYKICSTEYDE